MIRFGTVLTLSLAAAAGIGLYHAKYRVQALEVELAGLQQEILAHREAIHVLKAEWSFLNDPDRLAELARKHLELAPVAGAQLATIDDVPEKLPVPVPDAGDPANPDAGAPVSGPAPQIVAAPEAETAPAPIPVSAAAPSVKPAAPQPPSAEPSFTELPEDVQAVLASMRSPE